MDHYELSIKLIEKREKYHGKKYNDESTRSYIAESMKEVHNYFMNSEWRDQYLFSSMGYYDNDKSSLVQYHYNRDDGCMCDYTISLMNSLTQTWINKEESLSLTKMFLHEKNFDQHYKALFYKQNEGELKKPLKEFIYLDLKKYKWSKHENLESFQLTDFKTSDFGHILYKDFKKASGHNPFLSLKGPNPKEKDIEEFNRLIAIYLEIAANVDDNCFFYFLKPHTFRSEYNGLLVLGLKKELTPDEIEFWIDKTQRILAEIANRKLAQTFGKQAQVNLSNTSHILKTQIKASLVSQIQEVQLQIKHPKLKIIEENINKLFVLLGLQNLVDKSDSQDLFIQSAEREKLFTSDRKDVDFEKIKAGFNSGLKLRKKAEIIVEGLDGLLENNIFTVYGLYPQDVVVENFLYTIFENAEIHGEEDQDEQKFLVTVTYDETFNGLTFKNKAREHLQTHLEKYTGSIKVFNELLENSKSGKIITEFLSENGEPYFNLKIINENGV